MVFRIAPPQNTEAELQAFEDTCERLGGFDSEVDAERVEGFLTSLAALPQPPPEADWLAALFGETFERVFADPEDHAAGLRSVRRRLQVLCAQLDPEALFDDPGILRLEPMVGEWTDAERQQLADEGNLDAKAVAALQTGSSWAHGFMNGVRSFPERWAAPADEEAGVLFQQALDHIAALVLAPDDDQLEEHLARVYPEGPPPEREQLFVEACWSVQDLRMYRVEFAPRGSTRRVEPAPGRNDPCPCGSGKKYKKCHGAG